MHGGIPSWQEDPLPGKADHPWQGDLPWQGRPPPGKETPYQGDPPARRPPWQGRAPPATEHARRCGQQDGGTHPTGIHTC